MRTRPITKTAAFQEEPVENAVRIHLWQDCQICGHIRHRGDSERKGNQEIALLAFASIGKRWLTLARPAGYRFERLASVR